MKGFQAYNKFRDNMKHARQLYDITVHLYRMETVDLGKKIKSGSSLNSSLRTSVGTIEHNPTTLYQRLKELYPVKLRELILISAITSLEVYLTDVVFEIFKRDITPFKTNASVDYKRNYLLSQSSMNQIQTELISKDVRNLTSGGLREIAKYYNKVFNIDIKNIGINFHDIEKIHMIRHLFVHQNGFADFNFIKENPNFKYYANGRVNMEHNYLVSSLDKISAFAKAINSLLLKKYPDTKRNPQYYSGNISFMRGLLNLMLDISIAKDNFNITDYLLNLNHNEKVFLNYIVQITVVDNSCTLFISGSQHELSSFIGIINQHKDIVINKIIEIKQKA